MSVNERYPDGTEENGDDENIEEYVRDLAAVQRTRKVLSDHAETADGGRGSLIPDDETSESMVEALEMAEAVLGKLQVAMVVSLQREHDFDVGDAAGGPDGHMFH